MYKLSKRLRNASEHKIPAAATKYLLLCSAFRQTIEITMKYKNEKKSPSHPISRKDLPYIVLTVSWSVTMSGVDAAMVSSDTIRFEMKSGKTSNAA